MAKIKFKSPKVKPEFDVYIFCKYEMTSMGGPHYEVGEAKRLNKDDWFFESRYDSEKVAWKYVKGWVYLDDID